MWVYLSIYLVAILEGEIYYIAMCVAAAAGRVQWEGVLIAGALGGATGDQFWFYLLRGRIHWLDRYPWMARHRDAVVHRVKDNQNLILVISRFLPGLRTAIPIACAYARLRPLHFSSLNLVSAFLWASTIMLVVTKLGPGRDGPARPARLVGRARAGSARAVVLQLAGATKKKTSA